MRAKTLLLAALFALPLTAQSEPLRVVAMPHDSGDVFERSRSVVRAFDESFLREWRAAKESAIADGVKTLVIEITAADGDWTTTRFIQDDVADLRARGVFVAAYVPYFATGPAALIALEADRIVLGPSGSLGAADPSAIAGAGSTGKDSATLRREAVSRATAAARRGGHNELLVEAMIDPDVEIVSVRAPGRMIEYYRSDRARDLPPGAERSVVVRMGDLFTLDIGGAGAFGFNIKTAESRSELRAALGLSARALGDGELVLFRERDTGPSSFFVFDWTALLLVLGIVFLVLELKTPGLGVMGVLGLVALSSYFLINAGGGPGSLFSIGFLFVGFLLLLIEILILPGFGVSGVLGIVLIVFSIYSATIGLPGATLGDQLIPDGPADYARVKQWIIQFMTLVAAGTGGALALASQIHRFPILNRAVLSPTVLSAPRSPASGEVATSEGRLRLDAGVRGVAETDLRPSGVARLRERRVDVVADGEFVPRGSRVVVTSVEGPRVVVRREDPT